MGALPGASSEAELLLDDFGCCGVGGFEGEANLRLLRTRRRWWGCASEEEGGWTLEFFCGVERGGFGG